MRKIAVLLAAILAVLLPAHGLLAIWLGAQEAQAAAVEPEDYFYGARLAFNPDDGQFLMVKVREWEENGNGYRVQILAGRLNGEGRRIGEPIEILGFSFANGSSVRSARLDLGYDPANRQFLLIVAHSHADADICGAPAGDVNLCGMWLNADGTAAGQPFRIADEDDARLNRDLIRLAYDSEAERFVLAYAMDNLLTGNTELRVALIDPDGEAAEEATVHAAGTSAAVQDMDFVYEGSGRFLFAWSEIGSSAILGKYVRLNPSNAVLPFEPDSTPWPVGGGGNIVNLAHGAGKTAMLWADGNALTVSEVTYGGGLSNSAVIFSQSGLNLRATGIAYNSKSGKFAVIWQRFIDYTYPQPLSGVYLDSDLQVTEEYPILALFYSEDKLLSLAANTAEGHELVVFHAGESIESHIVVDKFGKYLQNNVAVPKLLYHPTEDAYYLVNRENVPANNHFPNHSFQSYLLLDKIAGDGAEAINVARLNIGGSTNRITADCCDSEGRILAVWEENNGGPLSLKAQWLDAGGPVGGSFSIDANASAPAVKYDPIRDGFSVVYKKQISGVGVPVTAKWVKYGSPVGTDVALSEPLSFSNNSVVALEYDPGAERMVAVWRDEENLYAQYFEADAEVSPEFSEPVEIGPVNAGAGNLSLMNPHFAVFDRNAGFVRVIWGQYEYWSDWRDYLRDMAVTYDGGSGLTQFGAARDFETQDISTFAYEPVYDAGEKSVILYWMETAVDGRLTLYKAGMSEENGIVKKFLMSGPRDGEAHERIHVAASNSGRGTSAVFYLFGWHNRIFDYGLIENVALRALLAELDGDPDSVSVADVVKYAKMNPSTDRNAILELLELIDPVLEPLPR